MSEDWKPCPFLIRMCSMEGEIIGYKCKGECTNCPASRPVEDALKAEVERLKEAIKEICNIADKGLDHGIEFIGAGLDGMTGGVEDWEAMKRARRKVRRLAKQALKNRK